MALVTSPVLTWKHSYESHKHVASKSDVETTHSINNQLIHQCVSVFVAGLEPPEVPGNGQSGQNVSEHPQTECDDGNRLRNTAVQVVSLGIRAGNDVRR